MQASAAAVIDRYSSLADEVRILSAGNAVLLPVSKTFPRSLIDPLLKFGVGEFGENRVQEVESKFTDDFSGRIRLIGHLQSNKVKRAVNLCSSIDSVDSSKLLGLIDRAAVEQGKIMPILLEYNSSGEAQKHGAADSDKLLELASQALALPGVQLCGLMTMGPITSDESLIAASFAATRKLFETIAEFADSSTWKVLSMGMSGDYRIALREGSTMVRIGTSIFGGR